MQQFEQQANFRFGEFALDPSDERLLGPDGPVRIGNKAFRVLRSLLEVNGRLLTKEELFDTAWEGTAVSDSALTSVIKELRRALGDESRKPRFIESVYGRGYRFLAPVSIDSKGALGAAAGNRAVQPPATVPPYGGTDVPGLQVQPADRWQPLRQLARARPILSAVAVLGSIAALIGLVPSRPEPAMASRQMGVEIAAISRDTNRIPAGLPDAIRNEVLAVINTDGKVQASLSGGTPSQPYLLAGGLSRLDGDQVRLSLRLTSRATGAVLWSPSVALPASAPGLPRDLGIRTAYTIRCGLLGAARWPVSEDNLSLYLRVCGPDPDTQRGAVLDTARELTRSDPAFVPGWTWVAQYAGDLASRRPGPDEAALRREALRAARTAQRLAPNYPESWAVMADALPRDRLAEREGYLRRALALPEQISGVGHFRLGNLYMAVGRWREAQDIYAEGLRYWALAHPLRVALQEVTLRLDPDDPQALPALAQLKEEFVFVQYFDALEFRHAVWGHRPADALAALRRMQSPQAMPPGNRGDKAQPGIPFPPARLECWRAALEALKREAPAAKAAAAKAILSLMAKGLPPHPIDLQLLGSLGADREAVGYAASLAAMAPEIARIELNDPMLDGMRRQPAFVRLAQSLGLVRYWREQGVKPDFCKAGDPPPVCAILAQGASRAMIRAATG